MDKDPLSFSYVRYGWVLIISLWGGIASYIQRVRDNPNHRYSLAEFVGELMISGFVGIMTFYICEWAEIPRLLAAAFIGVSSHMGSRGIFLLEEYINRTWRRYLDIK